MKYISDNKVLIVERNCCQLSFVRTSTIRFVIKSKKCSKKFTKQARNVYEFKRESQ